MLELIQEEPLKNLDPRCDMHGSGLKKSLKAGRGTTRKPVTGLGGCNVLHLLIGNTGSRPQEVRRDRKLSFVSTRFDYSRDAGEESGRQGL